MVNIMLQPVTLHLPWGNYLSYPLNRRLGGLEHWSDVNLFICFDFRPIDLHKMIMDMAGDYNKSNNALDLTLRLLMSYIYIWSTHS